MFNPSAQLYRIGRFEAVRLIGFGGVGVVFEARDPILDRSVAIKLCKDVGPAARAALRREAAALARLSHPNVVTVHEVGSFCGEMFYVMELVAGRSAHDYFRECERWQDAVEVYAAAGLGLAAAHAQSIVHGDFKPANVLIGRDGRVRVADFGLARAVAEHRRGPHERLGTLAFMAPERLRGEVGDARSDQFSFCVSLWQLLYGVRPFYGDSRAELLASIEAGDRRTAESLPRIPRRLRALLERGLAVAPEQRHPDMRTLVGALQGLRERPPTRRLACIGLVGLLGVGLGGAVDRAWLSLGGAAASDSRATPVVARCENARPWPVRVAEGCGARPRGGGAEGGDH